jgi:signal transduction histidine kinase
MSIEAGTSLQQTARMRNEKFLAVSSLAHAIGGVVVLAVAYYGAAKVGQALRYTGSVSAIWPPAGVGIAALYLWGLRLWPGILIGELFVNAELYFETTGLPLVSVVGQGIGNMFEVVVGAFLLRRLVGFRTRLDRPVQVSSMLIALGTATAISATFGTLSMLAGSVIDGSEITRFWRTWWLGDTSGALVVVPLVLAWAMHPHAAWRKLACREGLLLLIAVTALSAIGVTSTTTPLTYIVFPALIWAALRFGAPGATLSVAIASALTIGITAHHAGAFSKQPITESTLGTQVYVSIAALTALFLSAVVADRAASVTELAKARQRERESALEERHRIARDLHDSVSQTLFSIVLQTRTAEKGLRNGLGDSRPVAMALAAISDLTRSAQDEMRSLIFQLGRDPVENGLVAALNDHVQHLGAGEAVRITVEGPPSRLPLTAAVERELYAIGREALANVVRHAGATTASVRVVNLDRAVSLEVRDDGKGFDSAAAEPAGHFGLDSMRSRVKEIGGVFSIKSSPRGTFVRVEVPTARDDNPQ